MAKKHSAKDLRFISILTVCVSSIHTLIDLMRHEACFPHRDQDAQRIQAMMRGGIYDDPADRVVRLTRVAESGEAAQRARWQALGCVVLDERRPDVDPLTEAEVAARARAQATQAQVT